MTVSTPAGGVGRLLLIALLLELAMTSAMIGVIWVQWQENERIIVQKAHTETTGIAGRLAQVLERTDLLLSLMTEQVESAFTQAAAPSDVFSTALSKDLERISRHLPEAGRLLAVDALRRNKEIHVWSQGEGLFPELIALHADRGLPFAVTGAGGRRPSLVVSRRIDLADGGFGGILAVALDVDMIPGMRDNLDLSSTSLQLIDQDGRILVKWKRAALPAVSFPLLPASVGSWASDGRHEVISAEPVPGFSLRLVGAFPRIPFLEQWLNLLLWTFAVFTAVTLMAGFGIASVVRETRRRIEAEIGLNAANAELHAMIEAARRQADTDPLTGIANRRVFDERLEAEILRARRNARPLSLIMLDLDHFKSINDVYGHTFGDQVLATTAEIMRDVLRETDLPARYGGEEFVVVLPDTDLEGACTLAERLRNALDKPMHQPAPIHQPGERDSAHGGLQHGDQHGGEHGGERRPHAPLTVTASLGAAEYQAHENAVQFVVRADTALYRSKADGRNRVSPHPASRMPETPRADVHIHQSVAP